MGEATNRFYLRQTSWLQERALQREHYIWQIRPKSGAFPPRSARALKDAVLGAQFEAGSFFAFPVGSWRNTNGGVLSESP